MYKALILYFAVTFCSVTLQAQIYFEDVFDSGESPNWTDGIWSNVVKTDEGYFASAFSINYSGSAPDSFYGKSAIYGIVMNEEGEKIKEFKYGDSIGEYSPLSAFYQSGRYIVFSRYVADRGKINAVVFSSTGELEDEYFFEDTIYSLATNYATKTLDGGYLVCAYGTSNSQPDNANPIVFRLDSMFNKVWSKRFGGQYNDDFQSAIATPDKGFLLLGWTRSFGAGQRDFYLVKIDSLGNQEWQKTYGSGIDEGGWGIIQLGDGNYCFSGGDSNSKGRLFKVTPDGTEVWSKSYQYSGASGGNSVFWSKTLTDGSIVGVGLTNNNDEGDAGYLQKTDSEGNLLWQQKYNYNENTDLFYNLLPTADGGFLLGGFCSNPLSQYTSDAWLLKVDSLGCPYPNCTVGIEEENKTVAFNLWPNPATEVINVEVFNAKETTVNIKDVLGKEVYHSVFTEAKIVVDVSHFKKGMYLVEVGMGNTSIIKKLIVQ